MITAITITPVYAALLTLLFVALSVRTLRLRRRLQVGIGTGDSDKLLRATRVHANFAEYAPLGLLLALMVELMGGTAPLIHAVGLCLLAGRLCHAFGVAQLQENYLYRVLGMSLTFTSLVTSAFALLYLSLAAAP